MRLNKYPNSHEQIYMLVQKKGQTGSWRGSPDRAHVDHFAWMTSSESTWASSFFVAHLEYLRCVATVPPSFPMIEKYEQEWVKN